MLSQVIGDFLPSAVGVALSPIPVIAVILMLGTPRARSDGPAFATGWMAGMIAVAAVVLVLTSSADTSSTASDGVNWVKVAIGVVFLVMAVKQWRARPAEGEVAEMPGWMKAIDEVEPGRAFVLGAALSGLNPKNLALTLAATATISQAGLSTADSVVAVLVFVILASITVVGSVVFYLLAEDRARAPLAEIKAFMTEHNAVIMVVILVILGAKLLGDGFGGLG
ncbi:GAP family protein [Aquihabitans daechungensis]|uniref:GAP family protein n=1 Tax=Aquihabitans daechungensis TaxID=1052257 RepID=UPI003BA3DD87